jgi:hypothetical protein
MKKRWEWKCKLKWNGMETRIGGLKKMKEGKTKAEARGGKEGNILGFGGTFATTRISRVVFES